MKYADLHLHTLFSDGTYTPEELVCASIDCGLAAISITDHDSVDGLSLAVSACCNRDIEVIPGIELTAEYEGREVHVLGYLIDCNSKDLTEKLGVLRQMRVERIYKITDNLENKMGIHLAADSVFALAKGSTVGRLHIARAMVKEGIVPSIFEAFQKYIGDKSPAYVAGFRFSPEEAVALIRKINGIPVLAHPYSLNDDELIPMLAARGLMGIEVHYPEHTQSMVNFYLSLAQKYNLLVTGGSDCHGTAKPEAKIGSIKIPYELVEKLKDAQSGLR